MIRIACQAFLLDIEGTVAPVEFVYQVLFPYARERVRTFLRDTWGDARTESVLELLAQHLGYATKEAWFASQSANDPVKQQELVTAAVYQLMDRDAKVTGLKTLQGLIWREGFHSGRLISPLFPDVEPQLRSWRDQGRMLYVYSSGSVDAQKLFFGHTERGDLVDLFSGFFDTTTGAKTNPESYRSIAREITQATSEICFISDVVEELHAARTAGLQTLLRGAPAADTGGHPVIESFRDIVLQAR